MSSIRVNINPCTNGATVRYYMNGWHYFQFNGRYEAERVSEVKGTQVIERFSAISRIEQPTGKLVKLFYNVGAEGLESNEFEGLKGMLYAETVELYLDGRWAEVEVDRGSFQTRPNQMNAYDVICRLRIKNIGDIERAAIVPIPVVEPVTLYYEDFEGVLPWGFTLTKYTVDSDIEKATVDGSSKLRAIVYAEDTPQTTMIMRIELPDWEQNFGYIRFTMETLMAAYFPLVAFQNEGSYTRLVINANSLVQDLAASYASLKSEYEIKQTVYSTAPIRYLEIRFISYNELVDYYVYMNWLKLERL